MKRTIKRIKREESQRLQEERVNRHLRIITRNIKRRKKREREIGPGKEDILIRVKIRIEKEIRIGIGIEEIKIRRRVDVIATAAETRTDPGGIGAAKDNLEKRIQPVKMIVQKMKRRAKIEKGGTVEVEMKIERDTLKKSKKKKRRRLFQTMSC